MILMKRHFLSKLAIFAAILLGWNLSAFAQSTTFSYTGGVQSYTVPAGVTTIGVDMSGAQGGNATGSTDITTPGKGGRVQGKLTVTPGQVLNIFVGGAGLTGDPTFGVPGGFNGGGAAAAWGSPWSGGSGGGASDIRIGGVGLGNRVIVAGGGGGGGLDGTCSVDDQPGGDGGGLTGAGVNTCVATLSGLGFTVTLATGGSQIAGGNGGVVTPGGYTPGTAGSLGFGGASNNPGGISGGGGGGYYGGGGGSWTGGAGGSSYTDGSLVTSVTHTQGSRVGDGIVTLCAYPVAGTITGFTTVCAGSTTALANPTGVAGGTWTSSNTGIATVAPTTGIVTGVSAGSAIITYTTPANSCGSSIATTTVTVNPLPPVTAGSNVAICFGSSTPLTAGGASTYSWSPAAGLSATTGANVIATPTVTTTYTVTGTGNTAIVAMYNQAFVGGVAPTTQCTAWTTFRASLTGTYTGFTIRGSNNTTGITCTDPVVANAVATALRNGTAYSGVSDGQTWTVSIGGCTTPVCGPNYIELANQGACSCASGYSIRPTINNENWGGIDGVTCNAPSQTMEVDFYGTVTTCTNTATVTVTVNPLPSAITGTTVVCVGSTTTLADATADGTWSSSNPGVATVGSTTGVVTGVSAGITTIVYTITATGCTAATTVTVNPLPSIIVGVNHVCIGSSDLMLSDYTPGGAWSSNDVAIATVGSTGVVTGVAVGNTSILYTLPTGCFVSLPITVNALPVVSGGSSVAICNGASTPLTATGADVYSWEPATGLSCADCANPTASPTVTTTYTVTGRSNAFSTPLVYKQDFLTETTPTTQCTAWDAYRASLLGTYTYTGFTMRGSNNPAGISCTDPVVATAIANALRTGTPYTGTSDGQTWTVGDGCGSGCGTVAVELANQGSCSCGTGYSIRPAIANSNWGGINGATCNAGSQTLELDFYMMNGCSSSATVTVTVNPLPNVYNVTGGGSYCVGGTGKRVGLDSSNNGIRYQLYYGIATSGAPVDGRDSAITFGLRTGVGSYYAVATDTTTGCMSEMSGSVSIDTISLVYPTVSIVKSTPDTICAGTTTIYTATSTFGGADPVYIWKVNGGTVGTDSTGYAYIPSDGNRVNVLLVSSFPCPVPDTATSDTFRMSVLPNGTPTVHLNAHPGATVCEGTDVMIRATPTFGGHQPTYTWIKNTVVVGTDTAYSFVPVNGDQVYAIMMSNYLCQLGTPPAYSNAIVMDVQAPIVPSVFIYGRPGMLIGPGKPDTLVAVPTDGGTSPSYQWYINAAPVPGATSSVFIRNSYNNNDSVSCLITRNDACGLSSINSVVIKVGNVGVAPVVSADMKLSLVPNPNKGTFTVQGTLGTSLDEEVPVEVTDMLGQVVFRTKIMARGGILNEQIALDKQLANGMYMLILHTGNGISTFRFVTEQQ
jgi:uncharacterized protein YjdB